MDLNDDNFEALHNYPQKLVILIQPIFMVIETGLQLHHINNSVPHLLILLLFRQDLLLLDQNLNQTQLYLIVLAFILFQKALQIPITFYLYRIKDKALSFQKIDESNLIQKGLVILATIMQLQLTALHLLSSTFCMMSLTYAIRNSDQYIHLFLSTFTYIIWQAEYIFTLSLCSTPLTYKYHYLNITKVTILHYIIYSLQQLQIIIFCFLQDNQEIRIVNIIILLIEIISQLTNQFINHIYIFKESRQLLYFINSFKITLSCFYLQPTVNSEYLIIPMLICPIILYSLITLDTEINHSLFANIFKDSSSIPELIHQLKMILNQCDINIKMNPFKSSLINNFHRRNCDQSECICSNKLYILEISQANAITQIILKQFLRSKINYIIENKNVQKNIKVNELFLVQTLFYFDFGWLTDCIKNLTQLLNSSENNQNIMIQNNNNSIQKSKKTDDPLTITNRSNQQIPQYIYVKIQYDMTEYCRLNYVLHLAKFKLKSFLGTSMQAFQQLMVSDFITQFLDYDKCLREIQSQTLNLIHEKISFYHTIIKDEKRNLNILALQTKKIGGKLSQMKQRLKQMYNQYPCKSMQRCLCFFQSELLNNYYEANKTSSITSMSDDKIFRNKKIRNYEIQVDQTAYIVLSIKGNLDDFNIELGSSYLLQLIGQNSYKELQFYQLLPIFMRHIHPIIINNFFINGQSRFYKSFNQSFIQTKTGLLKTVFLTYDITKIILNQNLVFAAFIQELPDQKCFMLTYGNKRKLIFSENFFQKIGFDQKIILNLPQIVINSLNIQYLIPNFPNDHSETETQQINTEMRFLIDKRLKDLQSQGINLSEYILDIEQWDKEDQVCLYNISIMITKRFIEKQSYLLVEFSSITRITKYSQDISKFQTTQNIEINSPSRSPLIQQRKNSVSVSSIMNLSIDAQAKRVKIMDVRKKGIQINDLLDDEIDCNIASFRKDELQNHAPYQSQRQLLSERKNDTQQEFFNIDLLKLDSNVQSSLEIQKSQISNKKKIDQNDDIQSQQSSIGGIRESQLYKKFEMIEKIIKSKKFNTMIIYIVLLILLTMFWISYTIVVVTIMSSQLLQFIQEIDMISLHASIMGPHDMYLSIKVTVTAYQQQYREKYIDYNTLLKLVDPLFQFNAPYYFDLQNSFYEVLKNEHLTEFFIDKYETVYFMGNNDTVIYSRQLSFREELLAIINAQYQFKRIFDERKSVAGQSCQVFQFANYLNLQDQLELLTDEILEYSKNRSISSNNQWLMLWIIYQIISIVLVFILIIVRKRMLKTYEQLLSLFYYSDRNSLEQEIIKLKHLHQLITIQNEEVIQKYEFDFKQSEDLINLKKNKTHQQKIEKPKLRKTNQLPYFLTFSKIFIFYIYFLVYSVVIYDQTQNYLVKYRQTTDFYRLVQDMRFRSGAIYVYREIFFRWSNFTYLTNNDLNRMYQLVEKSQNIIQQYLNDQSDLQNDYLLSDNYINFINQVQNSNLCNFLDPQYTNLTIYCSISLDGVLLKGMIPSLNYISTSIRSQQAINNFTKRVEVHFYELEGAQIICQVFSNVSQKLQQGMIDLTHQFNYTNEILSYIFLGTQLFISIVIVSCFKNSLINEFTLYKKSLYLIPIQVLLGDNSLERALRQYEFTEKI